MVAMEQRRDSGDSLAAWQLGGVGGPGLRDPAAPKMRVDEEKMKAAESARGREAGARMRTVRGGVVSGARAAARRGRLGVASGTRTGCARPGEDQLGYGQLEKWSTRQRFRVSRYINQKNKKRSAEVHQRKKYLALKICCFEKYK